MGCREESWSKLAPVNLVCSVSAVSIGRSPVSSSSVKERLVPMWPGAIKCWVTVRLNLMDWHSLIGASVWPYRL
jgi:hypothetical protein